MPIDVQIYIEFVGIFILLVWALYLPFRGGQLYNGPFYCMAIGAYCAAYVTKYLGWNPGLALLIAILAGMLIGFLPALAFSKTTGIVTATVSMSLIFIVQAVIRNMDFIGGATGIWSIPKMDGLPVVIAVIISIIGIFVYRIDNSRIGRALEAMRTDPALASALGINIRWLSVFTMTVSSSMGALAGAFYAFTINSITADSFGFSLVLNAMAMLFVGGRYTMWGALVSVPILWGMPRWVPSEAAPYTLIFYGIILGVVIIIRPEGIVNRELLTFIKTKLGSPRSKSAV